MTGYNEGRQAACSVSDIDSGACKFWIEVYGLTQLKRVHANKAVEFTAISYPTLKKQISTGGIMI